LPRLFIARFPGFDESLTGISQPPAPNGAMTESPQASTFIIRLVHEPAGGISGVIERVRTGIKHKFEGRDALCQLIQILIANENGGQT
jgi:hypothetical protein